MAILRERIYRQCNRLRGDERHGSLSIVGHTIRRMPDFVGDVGRVVDVGGVDVVGCVVVGVVVIVCVRCCCGWWG